MLYPTELQGLRVGLRVAALTEDRHHCVRSYGSACQDA